MCMSQEQNYCKKTHYLYFLYILNYKALLFLEIKTKQNTTFKEGIRDGVYMCVCLCVCL